MPMETTSLARRGCSRTTRFSVSVTSSGEDWRTAVMVPKASRRRWASSRSFELWGGPSISKVTLRVWPCFSSSIIRSNAQ